MEGRFRAWFLGVLMLMAGDVNAQVTVVSPTPVLSKSQEPITPIPPPPPADPSKVALGERLFNDPRLSNDGKRACSSCHDIRTNGASNRLVDVASNRSPLRFNTPTVFNAALDFRLNWQGNIRTLEDQAEESINDPQTMATNVDAAVKAVTGEGEMTARFQNAYGHGPDRASLLNAIATYERSLVTPGGRFDRWLSGDKTVLSFEEITGYQLFKSFGCVSCHQGVNVGGNLLERSGVFHNLSPDGPMTLRVPSLRNVAVTAPYFHDGGIPALSRAVHAMGYAQLDRDLSADQVHAIVAFLNTLTGFYQGRQLTAPP
jgi:cytochrome c peroxidase